MTSRVDRTARLGCGMLVSGIALLSGACDPASTDALGADAVPVDARVEDAGASAPLAFATRELEPACAGEAYEGALVVTGGAQPLRWRLSDDLPPGLSLVAAEGREARIEGETRASGPWPFRVRVEDADGAAATAAFVLEVVECDFIGPTILTGAIPDLPRGQPVAFDLEAEGGQPPYRWAVARGELPPGIALSETGQLSGTPTGGAACAALQIRVTDDADRRDRQSYFICVVEP